METVHERLSYYIESKGFTLRSFCQKFDFQYNSFTQIANGTRPLGINILNKIVSALPNLSVDWLLYGRGDMEWAGDNVIQISRAVSEPELKYSSSDLFIQAMIKGLDDKSVRKKIVQILNAG